MAQSAIEKLELNNNKVKGALDIIDESCNTKSVEDKVEKEKTYLRSYTLTKKQLTLLQLKKIEEIDLTLSEIVGKAIESYCSPN